MLYKMNNYKLSESEQNELKTLCRKYYETAEFCRDLFEDGVSSVGTAGVSRGCDHWQILDYIGMDRSEWRDQVIEFYPENKRKELVEAYEDWESFYVVVLNRAEWLRWSKECPDESWSSEYGWRKGYVTLENT